MRLRGEMIMNRLLIIDGSNLLFQMFFGMPARIVNKQGKLFRALLVLSAHY